MPCQLVKRSIPPYMLLTFLDMYATKTPFGYIFNKESYKRASLKGGITRFCTRLLPFYHTSKSKYLTRTQSFVNFSTIVRQLCRHLNIGYTSSIKYQRTSYSISYHIYSKQFLSQCDQ